MSADAITTTPEDVLAGRASWCVVQGDCTRILQALPAGAVDVMLTDPPYSEHVHAKVRRGGSVHAPDDTRPGHPKRATVSTSVVLGFDALSAGVRAAVALEARRLVRRWCLTFSDLEGVGDWRQDCEAAGLEHVRTGLWVKLGCTPQFTGDRPASGAEAIEIAARPEGDGADALEIAHPPGRKRWGGGGGHAVWSHPIVRAGDDGGRAHPTQKPLSLMLELVELFTEPGEVVLDPFCGSGTTGVACLLLGRRFIGVELQAQHVETARRRMEGEGRGLPLRAVQDAPSGQRALFAPLTSERQVERSRLVPLRQHSRSHGGKG